MEEDVYVTASAARLLLRVSKTKMAAMLRAGEMPWVPDPANKRAKLIRTADIAAWNARRLRPKPTRQPALVAAHVTDTATTKEDF